MAIYYGVVRDKHVVFEQDVPLAEGTLVEVRPREGAEQARAERVLNEALRAAGILVPAEVPVSGAGPGDPDEEFEPVTVTGRPLSEQIIDERR